MLRRTVLVLVLVLCLSRARARRAWECGVCLKTALRSSMSASCRGPCRAPTCRHSIDEELVIQLRGRRIF